MKPSKILTVFSFGFVVCISSSSHHRQSVRGNSPTFPPDKCRLVAALSGLVDSVIVIFDSNAIETIFLQTTEQLIKVFPHRWLRCIKCEFHFMILIFIYFIVPMHGRTNSGKNNNRDLQTSMTKINSQFDLNELIKFME